jgi:hypothetical protein
MLMVFGKKVNGFTMQVIICNPSGLHRSVEIERRQQIRVPQRGKRLQRNTKRRITANTADVAVSYRQNSPVLPCSRRKNWISPE